MRKPSKTDLTDQQWTIVKPLIPPARPGGRPRETDLRAVLNTLLYQARTGCPWDRLPHDLWPQSTVWDYFAPWRDDGPGRRITDALRPRVRGAEGRDPTPRGGPIDRQTVETTEVGGITGDDGGQKSEGRERQMVVDSLGSLLAVPVTAAAADDGTTAPPLLGPLDRRRFPRLEVVWGDAKYRNAELDGRLERSRAPFRVEGVKRRAGSEGFVKLPRRWVSERTFAWRGRDRRHSKDDEWRPESNEAWARISAIGQMVRRLAPDEERKQAPFMYEREAAA